MSIQNNRRKCIASLQHMTKVKTVEVLWRNSVNGHELKNPDPNSLFNVSHNQPMCEQLDHKVDKLPVPETIKQELNVLVIEMVSKAISWLSTTSEGLREDGWPVDENDVFMFSYFAGNFAWGNSGCADPRGMIRSYVRNKETVDFSAWRLLCDYNIQDDILRFSQTIDWKKLLPLRQQSFMY